MTIILSGILLIWGISGIVCLVLSLRESQDERGYITPLDIVLALFLSWTVTPICLVGVGIFTLMDFLDSVKLFKK